MTATANLRARPLFWLRWPRRTARLRFAAVYTGLFLLSGAALIATTYLLFEQATHYTTPQLPEIPHTPAIQALQLPTPLVKPPHQLPQALSALLYDQNQIDQTQQQLLTLTGPGPAGASVPPPESCLVSQLTHDQQQLTQDQHQLTLAVNQLSQAVHQVSQAGTAQTAQRARDSHDLLVNSGIALAITAALSVILGWLVAGRMLRPLRTITATARHISASNLRQRLALDGADEEFKHLGDTLDDLFARLEASFLAQRHFVANASHELRTPITAERNLLQVALDDPHTSAQHWRETAQELLASNDEQSHLIEALLALASSESGLDRQERTDLAGICRSVLNRPVVHSNPRALQIQTTLRSAPVDGDPTLIQRLVSNLVDNAIEHNVPGGHVHIATATADGEAVLVESNTGPDIPADQLERLFQPFQRLDPRRTHHHNGHGLGLSIVQTIATTHHATIRARPEAEGGLTITIAFPPPANRHDTPPRTRRFAASRT